MAAAAPGVAVAYSGGRDSTALLHATVAACRGTPVRVVALHVHHGLQREADAWLDHCASTCGRWARRGALLHFDSERLGGTPAPGESVEAWAREHRYAALAGMARRHQISLVLLAHHRRDQAETFVLQALRGAGLAGLSAMGATVVRDGVRFARPWLEMTSDEIAAYARRHRLRHVEDPSNDDRRHARSRLRRDVWPVLLAAFPQAEAALSRAATWSQQAQECLDELAAADLLAVAGDRGLDLRAIAAWSLPRRSNLLRAWLHAQRGSPAPASLVERLLNEAASGRAMRWPDAQGEWRASRGWLRHVAAPADARPAARRVATAIDERGGVDHAVLQLRGPGRYPLPQWNGTLDVADVTDRGLPAQALLTLHLKRRRGGEQFQAGPSRPPRALKKQYQQAQVPDDGREGPLAYVDERLVFVPGLGVDARAWGAPGTPQYALRWLPTPGR